MMRRSKSIVSVAVLILTIASIAVGFIVFMNSPKQVAHRWADALARRDGEAMKKLVSEKDQGRVAGLLSIANMLPDMNVQLSSIEDQKEQKIARVSVKFSRVVIGNLNLNLSGNLNLPFVLTRERILFWKIDLEKSEPLIREEVKKAAWEAVKRNPVLQQFLPSR